MLSKKINAKLKRAFYYFGFEQVVAYDDVKLHMDILKVAAENDEQLSSKVDEYAAEIEEYFSVDENNTDEVQDFAKGEPRKSWESYTEDFPQDVFEESEAADGAIELIEEESEEVAIESAEEVSEEETDIEPIEEIDIEPVEDVSEEETSIEPVEEVIEDIEETDIEPVEEVVEIEDPEEEIDDIPQTKIYINGELLGYCTNPEEFTQEMREKRRSGIISHEMNITYYSDNNEIYIFNDPGRARRPLIIVKEGIPLLREEHLNKVANGKLKWDDLINDGLIEYLDAEEEENSYIAMTLADLNDEHTHLEIDPATMLGICAGIIPFSDHNSSPRNTMEAGMTKQALGLYVSNYALRTDTRAHLLHHPQTPIVKTRIIDSTNYDLRPSGQNFVVALMSYEGYNMEDAMVINKAALERGLARSSFFRAYDTSEKRYAGGQVDKFEVPDKNIKGYRSEEVYRNLDDDGVVNPESEVKSGDVLIGKTSPPRFLEEDFGSVADRRRETSVTVRHGEKGIVAGSSV